MVNESRIDIYEYIESVLTSVTENVYLMNEPQELTDSDTKDGFIVITIGDFVDASEFPNAAYGMTRVFVQCYVPPISRGRLDKDKYKAFENAINSAIKTASEDNSGRYWIQPDSLISADFGEDENANNAYYMFVKSFIVETDESQ